MSYWIQSIRLKKGGYAKLNLYRKAESTIQLKDFILFCFIIFLWNLQSRSINMKNHKKILDQNMKNQRKIQIFLLTGCHLWEAMDNGGWCWSESGKKKESEKDRGQKCSFFSTTPIQPDFMPHFFVSLSPRLLLFTLKACCL